MEGIKLNEEITHIFKEAILDFHMGAQRGNATAIHHHMRFSKFLKDGIIPLEDLAYLYGYYKAQKADVDKLTDPRLDELKKEVNYMWNLLNDKYKFSEDSGALLVEAV